MTEALLPPRLINMTARSSFPLVRAIECFDPLDLLPALARLRHPFLLHSSLNDDAGRWSFFGAEPFEYYSGPQYDTAVTRWRELSQRMRAEGSDATAVPVTGGAVGSWSYDFGRRLERPDALAQPAQQVGLLGESAEQRLAQVQVTMDETG